MVLVTAVALARAKGVAHQGEGQVLSFIAGSVDQAGPLLEPVPELLKQHSCLSRGIGHQVLIQEDQVVAGDKGAMNAFGFESSPVELWLQFSLEKEFKGCFHLKRCCFAVGKAKGRQQTLLLLGLQEFQTGLLEQFGSSRSDLNSGFGARSFVGASWGFL